MEEVLANIEQQMSAFQILDDNDQNEQGLAPTFVSAIKINGKPIPPPVMTKQKRQEMRELRNAAVKREQDIANQRRLRLLEKVQTIVNEMEERRSSSQGSHIVDSPVSADQKSDASLNQDNHPDTISAPEAISNPTTSELLSQSTDLSASHSLDVDDPRSLKVSDGHIASAQASTSSSSDASLLNQTVVAASDFSRSPTDLEEDSSRTLVDLQSDADQVQSGSYDPSLSKDARGTISETPSESDLLKTERESRQSNYVPGGYSSSQGMAASVKLACSWSRETEGSTMPTPGKEETPPVTRAHLMPSLICSDQGDEDDLESFDERESYLSLLGEYSSLPMPTGSSHFFSDVSDLPSSTPLLNPSPVLIVKPLGKSHKSPFERPGRSPHDGSSPKEEVESSMFLSTSSTMMTNTAGQSCTLPSSLRTASAASTLHDIDDPWNTLTETPVPTAEGLEFHSNINASRGTPVGQEDSGGNLKTAANSTKPSSGSTSSENELSSPEKRVRRDSYTLDHPSPALLNAQARSEAPHAHLGANQSGSSVRRSLELTKDEDREMSANTKETSGEAEPAGTGQKFEQNEGSTSPTEESFLQQQLRYFEEMRHHLEQQQRQQLQQLLMEQQHAQIALQQEMAQLERRFRQRQEESSDEQETRREMNRDNVLGKVDGTKEPYQDAESVATPSPQSNVSVRLSPASKSPQISPSTDISSIYTSPSIFKKVSPTNNAAATSANGAQVEPFYLGGDQSGQVAGGSSGSPVVGRLPCEGENIKTSVVMTSPFNKMISSPSMSKKFDKVSAAVKGYLTRRLYKTSRIQSIIKTIKDSASFADKFISETPIKKGGMSLQDMALAERVLAQVRAAQYDLYDIFYTLPVSQRMELIQQSRRVKTADDPKIKVKDPSKQDRVPSRPLSAATVKALERKKKAKEVEAKLFGDRSFPKTSSRSRPMSAAEGRILKPLLSQRSPARPASANTYRPSKYGSVISHERPKTIKDPPKLTHDPVRSKVTSHRAPGNAAQGSRSTKARSPVAVKTKGVRRSLYPITNPSRKTVHRFNTESRK